MKLAFKIPITAAAAVAFIVGVTLGANPPTKKEARVTQIIREVNLLPAEGSPRPAVQNDEVEENTAVRTGDESRSELTFEDLTITRLGANTVFTFNKAGRSGQLESGAILLRVPKDSGGAEFKTRAVTVGITGTTVIFESTRLGNSKLIVLEGHARLALIKHPKESAKVRVGQMLRVPAGAVKVPQPEDVDLDQIVKTHPLLTDFPPLPSDDLIRTAIKKQQTVPPAGAAISQGTPGTSSAPTPSGATGPFTPTPPPNATAPPKVTPIRTPPRRPRPPPKPTATPKATPRSSPRSLPRQIGNVPGQSAAGSTPTKKIIGRPTPKPSPPVIR